MRRQAARPFKNAQNRTQVNLWLLNYTIDSTDMRNGRLLIQVRRKDIGFQMVEVLAPRGTKIDRTSIDFIDQEGRVLETISTGVPWSRIANAPGLVGAPRQRPVKAVEVVPGTRTELADAELAPRAGAQRALGAQASASRETKRRLTLSRPSPS